MGNSRTLYRIIMSAICLNAFGFVATTPAESAQKAKSPAEYIIGNTVHGTEDDGEFFDYYAPNGSATSKLVANNDITHGRWTIENTICASITPTIQRPAIAWRAFRPP